MLTTVLCLAFAGDCRMQSLLSQRHILSTKVLICELTYLEEVWHKEMGAKLTVTAGLCVYVCACACACAYACMATTAVFVCLSVSMCALRQFQIQMFVTLSPSRNRKLFQRQRSLCTFICPRYLHLFVLCAPICCVRQPCFVGLHFGSGPCTLTMMPALFSAVGVPSPLQEPQAPSPRPLFNQARHAQSESESDCVGAQSKAFAQALILLSLTRCLASAFPNWQIPHASHMPALAAATSCNPRCVCVCVWGGDVCGTCFFHVSICFGWHQPTIECPCCLPDRTSLCLSAFGETHPDVKWAMERTISVPVSSLDSCNSGKLQRGNGQ